MYLDTVSLSGVPCSWFTSAKFDNFLVKEITLWQKVAIWRINIWSDKICHHNRKKSDLPFQFYQRQWQSEPKAHGFVKLCKQHIFSGEKIVNTIFPENPFDQLNPFFFFHLWSAKMKIKKIYSNGIEFKIIEYNNIA